MALLSHLPSLLPSQHYKLLLWLCSMLIMSTQEENVTRSQQHRTCRHTGKKSGIECISNTGYWNNLDINQHSQKKKRYQSKYSESYHIFPFLYCVTIAKAQFSISCSCRKTKCGQSSWQIWSTWTYMHNQQDLWATSCTNEGMSKYRH